MLSLATYGYIRNNCEEWQDAVQLFLFYAHKMEKETEQFGRLSAIWATNAFCWKTLGWGNKRFLAAKKALKKLGLVQDERRDGKDYIRLKYSRASVEAVVSNNTSVNQHYIYTEQEYNTYTQNKNINTRTGNYFLSPDELDS